MTGVSKPALGFIGLGIMGLGIMGAPMARHLLNAGYAMTVWNRTASKAEPLVAAGATLADSPRDVAGRGPEVIFLNVTDTPDVEAVLFGDDGLAHAAPARHARRSIIPRSTPSRPATSRRGSPSLVSRCSTRPSPAATSGRSAARSASWSAATTTRFATCLPMFEVTGERVVHVGPVGMGQVCKACNQIACASTLIGACEALAFAKANGLELDKMIEVVAAGAAAGSWQLANLGPKIVAGDFEPGFFVDYLIKDLRIVTDAAASIGVELDFTGQAAARFAQGVARGVRQQGHAGGGEDIRAVR